MKKGRIWMIAGSVFLLGAIIYCMYNFYREYSAGERVEAVYEELSAIIEETIAEKEAEAAEDTESEGTLVNDTQTLYEQYPNMEMPTVEIDGNRYIGILEIESIGLELPVMSDWSMEKLETSPCRYSGSVYSHDIVICGHNYRRHFSPIKWLEIGTTATFTDVDGNQFYYELSYTDVIAPEDIDLMKTADGTWDLTLFTCTTGGGSRMTLRFVLTGSKAVGT